MGISARLVARRALARKLVKLDSNGKDNKMTVKKLLTLQGLALLGLIVGAAVPLGKPYDFNVPLCTTPEGLAAATSGKQCQSCPGYSYWENARLNILEFVAAGRPVIINAGIVVDSSKGAGPGIGISSKITVMHSHISRNNPAYLTLTTREDARRTEP